MIRASAAVLALADSATRIIPGHGPVATRETLLAYATMLETVRATVATLMREGADLDAVLAARPTANFDAQWAGGALTPAQFVGIVYRDQLARR